jgi:Mrp family chromosome partitioning ATPase
MMQKERAAFMAVANNEDVQAPSPTNDTAHVIAVLSGKGGARQI